MNHREIAPRTASRRSSFTPLRPSQSEGLPLGTRFFQAGHWWEVDGLIHGRATSYYKCKPVCGVESRFYTESEIRQALNTQLTAMNISHNFQDSDGRGTGRFATESSHVALRPAVARRQLGPSTRQSSAKTDTLKVLLVGTRDAVKKAIAAFHATGYANTADWSPFQIRPNSKEVLSILVQKI
ncbi:hypothetical protein GFS31_07250 [Leptolyngbya sp. BL0902]|uniref:hypothetical protein n=1 Tax=Leptolyngbya sp. BL0902 TaxID=1115757 RepID=UPI0018E757D4|nr:hypothetical protein [Leptolyngbya sp. BL0902]QQE64053.1 hypothetical protein GFS31_07250 [Leptolyngbya sp. BL0902]